MVVLSKRQDVFFFEKTHFFADVLSDPPELRSVRGTPPTVFEGAREYTQHLVPLFTSPTVGLISIGYRTVDGTAKSGDDYTAAEGKLTFSERASLQFIPIWVRADDQPESEESFTIEFFDSEGTKPKDPITITIRADDLLSDTDGDGRPLMLEYAEYTDPLKPDTGSLLSIVRSDNSVAQLLPPRDGLHYEVQTSQRADAFDWKTVLAGRTGAWELAEGYVFDSDSGRLDFADREAAPPVIYLRVVVRAE